MITAATSLLRPADNPFASHRIDRLSFRPQGQTWKELLERLDALRWRAAIVGPEGSGKTALLQELAVHAAAPTTLIALRRDTPRPLSAVRERLPATPGRDRVLLVDGADLLGPLEWRRLRRVARFLGGLVVTEHRPGRLPTLIACRTSPALLKQLVGTLAPEHLERLDPLLPGLFARHGGNLRACLLELYDMFAGREVRE